MDSLHDFKNLSEYLYNSEVRSWKENGGRIIGVQCSSIPEEIIHAAGLLPMRVRAPGVANTKNADAHLHRINCSYTRSVLEFFLQGELNFLDGFVATNTCDHHLRLAAEIKENGGLPFFHYFQMFHTLSKGAREWLIQEMKNMTAGIEKAFDLVISEESIRNTISIYNETRCLMARLNELRKKEPPPLTGSEYMDIALTGMLIPRLRFNEKLRSLLNELENRPVSGNPLPRLMVIGGACDSSEFIDFIESKGACVVADAMCFGLRQYMGMIDQNSQNPIEAIADRYMARIPCPAVIDGFDYGYPLIKEMIQEYRIDGVVFARLKFCDHFAGAKKLLADELRKDGGVPVIELEREYNTTKSGQLSTRIQAFLELL
jgi:benzoyl-CoA reductase subunit C